MIHDQQTIDRIKELLQLSKVTDQDILEEMTDHYLSEIERQVAEQINHQAAIRSTFQQIAFSDFSTLSDPYRKTRKYLILFLSLATLFSYYIWQQHIDLPIEKQQEEMESYWPEGWPLIEPNRAVTAQFGKMYHPVLKISQHHKGIDIKAHKGTTVIATGDAIVKEVGFTNRYGHYIILQHSERYATKYCHLSEVKVHQDQEVTMGYTIGAVGSSGHATSPHLHYEIIDGADQIDPLECIRA